MNSAMPDQPSKMKWKDYSKELRKLQTELCHLQEWVKKEGLRVIIVFEGRDAAGKGGTIKAITERVSPRVFRVIALPAPSDREKTQLFMQRYIENFPAAGEVVIFDRSWYNRAGVEYVMGFCTEEEHTRFLKLCPEVEGYITAAGIQLIKIWLEVGKDEQARRMEARIDDPLRQWKLSPMDVKSWARWYDYSRARDLMLEATDTEASPWHILAIGRQAEGATQLHFAYPHVDPLQEDRPVEDQAAEADEQGEVRRRSLLAGTTNHSRQILTSRRSLAAASEAFLLRPRQDEDQIDENWDAAVTGDHSDCWTVASAFFVPCARSERRVGDRWRRLSENVHQKRKEHFIPTGVGGAWRRIHNRRKLDQRKNREMLHQNATRERRNHPSRGCVRDRHHALRRAVQFAGHQRR